MTKVLGDGPKEEFPVPDKVILVPVDMDPSNECVRVVTMAFIRGTEPAVGCGARRQATPPDPTAPPAPAPAGTPGQPQSLLLPDGWPSALAALDDPDPSTRGPAAGEPVALTPHPRAGG
jgi:hypothetical protein